MTWNKPDIPDSPPVAKPKLRNWIIGSCLYTLFALIIIWFFRNNTSLSANTFTSGALFATPVLLALAIRSYIYFYGVHNYSESWHAEKVTFDNGWQEWANESVTVIDSYFATATGTTAQDITAGAAKTHKNEKISFSKDGNFISSAYQSDQDNLFHHLDGVLKRLPECKIDILFMSSPNLKGRFSFMQELEAMLKERLAPYAPKIRLVPLTERIAPDVIISHNMLEDGITHLLDIGNGELINNTLDSDEGAEHLQLLLVYNLYNRGSTEFIGYFLLATHHFMAQREVKHKGRILRQLTTQEPDKATDQLIEMQPVVTQSQRIWLTHQSISYIEKTLVWLLQKFSAREEETPPVFPEQHNIDLYLGVPSALSHWLALHFACDMADSQQSVELIIGREYLDIQLTVVVPSSLKENRVQQHTTNRIKNRIE